MIRKKISVYLMVFILLSGVWTPNVFASGQQISGFSYAIGIDYYDNHLYVADYSANAIKKVSLINGTTTSIVVGLQPISVALNKNGDLYFTKNVTNRIYYIKHSDLSSSPIDFSTSNSVQTAVINDVNVSGLAFDTLENLYFSEYISSNTNSNVKKITKDTLSNQPINLTTSPEQATDVISGLTSLFADLAFDSLGNLYINDLYNGKTYKLPSDELGSEVISLSNIPERFNTTFGTTTGIGITDNGNIYVSNASVINLLNAVPVAMNVNLSGNGSVGSILTGSYDYSDVEGDSEDMAATTFKWYRADDNLGTNKTVITGVTNQTYVVQEADRGKYISFEVTPVATTGEKTGNFVMSNYIAIPNVSSNAGLITLTVQEVSSFTWNQTTFDSITVANNVTSLTVNAIPSDSNATVTINGNATTSDSITLTVGQNTIPIVVTAEDGTTQTYSLTITRQEAIQPPSSGGSSGGGSSSSPSNEIEPAKLITPTNKKEVKNLKVTVTVEKDENGVEVTVVKLNKEEFKNQLSENKDVKAFVIPTDSQTGKAKAVLQVRDMEDAAANNTENVFIIKAGGAEYSLPSSLVNSPDVATRLGISEDEASNAEVELNIEEKPASTVKAGKSKISSKVVDFSITVKSGDNEIKVNNFGNTYVDRTFDLTGSVSADKAVGVVVNANGAFSPVPTEFADVDGKKVAVLKRNSNSVYTVVSNDVSFTDINNHWAKENILLLGNKLIVDGYEDGSFKPQGTITRGEFVTIIARSLGLDTTNKNVSTFSDVNTNDWYAGALKAVTDFKIVSGFEDGTFKANEKITRQDAAVIIARVIQFLELQNSDEKHVIFKDGNQISNYAKNSVGVVTKMEIIKGYEDNSLKPLSPITRAETVKMIETLLEHANFISK